MGTATGTGTGREGYSGPDMMAVVSTLRSKLRHSPRSPRLENTNTDFWEAGQGGGPIRVCCIHVDAILNVADWK